MNSALDYVWLWFIGVGNFLANGVAYSQTWVRPKPNDTPAHMRCYGMLKELILGTTLG